MTFDPATLRQDYGDALDEARTCRRSAALFDFSFVARGRVTGDAALRTVQSLVARPLAALRTGEIAYAVRVDAGGFILSDVTVWRTGPAAYELMSGRNADVADLLAAAPRACAEDLSGATSILAVQGPDALKVLRAAGCGMDIGRLGYFQFADTAVAGIACRVGRLGYTGEPGFEIVAHRGDGAALWNALSPAAAPAGFAAANVLRIEAGFILLCNELQLRVTPPEARLSAFAGGAEARPTDECRLVTFRSSTRGTPSLWRRNNLIARPARLGQVVATSACTSPLVEGTLGLGFVRLADLQAPPPRLVSDDFGDVEVLAHPYYDTAKRRPRLPWGDPGR